MLLRLSSTYASRCWCLRVMTSSIIPPRPCRASGVFRSHGGTRQFFRWCLFSGKSQLEWMMTEGQPYFRLFQASPIFQHDVFPLSVGKILGPMTTRSNWLMLDQRRDGGKVPPEELCNSLKMFFGWWFGTSLLFSHILGIIIPID